MRFFERNIIIKYIQVMKKGYVIKIGILFSMFFIFKPNLQGQDGKAKNRQPDVKIDVRREYDENGNVSRYDSSYSFSWSYDNDSLFQYIDPGDSDYFFREPFDFFGNPSFANPFNDSLYDEFFNDPMHGQNLWNDPDFDFFHFSPSDSVYNFFHPFDIRSMMENHRRMMEEMHKYFEYHFPNYPMAPDSIPQNSLKQRYHGPSGPLPKGREI
jgi:hypothetical protein